MSKVIAASAMLLGGAGTAVTGAYAMGLFGGEPKIHLTLNELTDSDDSVYKDKVGKQYEYLLVAPDKTENKEWWEWSYRRWQKDSSENESDLSDEFKVANVTKAFPIETPSSEQKSLNKVCDSVYKKGTSDINQTDENKKKLVKNLFKYCSVLGNLPLTVKDKSQVTDTGKIGKTEEAKLIATKGEENLKFWQIKSKWFEDLKVNDQSEYFGKNVGSGGEKKSLKDACEESYGRNSSGSESGNPTKDNVVKYCSLDTAGVTRSAGA